MIKALHNTRRPLTCVEFENRVNDLLDSRRDFSDDKILLEHASICDQCEKLISDYSVFNQLEFGRSTAVVAKASKPGVGASEKRWSVLAIVAAALVICGLLLVDVSQTGENGSAAVALAEPVSQETMDVETWENGVTEPVSIGPAEVTEKMPASLKVGQAFASTNLGAVSWEDLGKNLESLQPVWGYSRRIPVVSSVQSTVDLTIGLIRAKKQESDLPAMEKNTTPDYGFLLNRFDGLA